jgi:uncharacterized membrane protein
MCAHTNIYASSYYYICALILLYMRPHTTMHVCSHGCLCVHTCYIYVLILLRMSVWQQYEDAYVAVAWGRICTATRDTIVVLAHICVILPDTTATATHMCASTTIVSRDLASYYCDTHICVAVLLLCHVKASYFVLDCLCVCVCVYVCVCVCVVHRIY